VIAKGRGKAFERKRMSFNHGGGNDANHPNHKFLHCNAQNLAGLTSPSDEQRLLMQHRFTEQHAEEQQRLLQIQQLVAANSNQLIVSKPLRISFSLFSMDCYSLTLLFFFLILFSSI
jgi:hypothetical protein